MNWSLESSIFLRQLRNLKSVYLTVEEKISSIYLDSFTHRLIKKIIAAIRIGFRHSIFGRLTELKEIQSRDFFETSKVIKILLNWARKLKDRRVALSATSNFVIVAKDIRQDSFSQPLKDGGLIVTCAIMVNVIFSIVLRKEITLWSWLIRGLFLFAGLSGLFCQANWSTVKKTSIFLKRMR